MTEEKVGWIGVGNMGLPMARNLQRKGYHVTVLGHSRREPVEIMKREGASEASSPSELARNCNVIFSIVWDKEQTDEVIFGKNGLWQELDENHTLIISSTLTPGYCVGLAERAKREKGAVVLDAPVSGGPWGAEARTLSFMVGGLEQGYQRCKPYFEAMGKNIFYTGGIGTGQAAKLVNNVMALVNAMTAFEAITLAKKAGIQTQTMLEIAKVSTGDSYLLHNWDVAMKGLKGFPRLTGVNKDLLYALDYAGSLDLKLPIVGLVAQLEPVLPE
jgi:3-hydroxyisobutyrate dehydrogenase-like beta-hydroxyacid dehydrogenase